jgi:hypothetical protein
MMAGTPSVIELSVRLSPYKGRGSIKLPTADVFLLRVNHDEMCQINNAPGLAVILTALRCRLLFV